ncbi:MAG: trypsin-like peptidase domain-containing protein [Patescibacteria group bacterium]|nr:trypsin-like peptidase domain-containing protein [Patescibacteria group bacterium]
MIPLAEDILVEAVEKISKSVVNIASVKMVHDQLFRVFPVRGVGSGVMIDKNGHVLTNHHVIDDAEKLRVTLSDGRVFNGKIVGADPSTDLAVIKIETKEKIPIATLGDSGNLKVGQIVLAVGNPFGLTGGPTVTSGIVSSLKRNIQTENGMLELIQTDAAINPGNSGGPLVNTAGEVIAINTANMPYAQGIGFAVPVNTAKSILKDLIEKGRVIRPWIGIVSMKVTRNLARYYGLPLTEGALVVQIEPFSPADSAGIRKGDILEKIDGNKITEPSEISTHIHKKQVGDEIIMTINRNGRTVQISLQLEENNILHRR